LVARPSSRPGNHSTGPRSSAPPGAERPAAVDHQRRLHPAQSPAIASAFLGAAWQRCRAPFLRNVLAQVLEIKATMPAAAITAQHHLAVAAQFHSGVR